MKNIKKRIKKASGTSEIQSNGPIYTLWESQKEKKRDKEAESVFKEIVAESFPNLGKEMDIQMQETQKILNKSH